MVQPRTVASPAHVKGVQPPKQQNAEGQQKRQLHEKLALKMWARRLRRGRGRRVTPLVM